MQTKRFACFVVVAVAMGGSAFAAAWNVRDFGAKGDGAADDTAAVQSAIDKGGEVYLPPGVYSCGTLYLRSGGGLRLDDGATIRAIPDPSRYNRPDFCPQNGSGENKLAAHLIVAVGCTNVFVRGGTIDGNSPHFHKGMKIHYRSMRGRPTKSWPKWLPAQMMFFCECDGVAVEDSRLVNATFWSCFFHGCDNVVARRLDVRTDPKIAGDDGIDVDSCRNVVVEDCVVDTGDDAIAIRGSPARLTDSSKACEHVRVRNCRVRSEYANGVRVGVGGGTIRDVRVSNLTMENTRGAIHVNPRYSDAGRGVDISDVTFENITATCDNFIFLVPDFFFVKTNRFDRALHDIRFTNLSGTCRLPLVIRGNGLADVHDIVVEKSRFTFVPAPGMPSGDWEYFLLDGPGGTLVTNDTRNVVFRDVVFDDRR